MAVYVDDMRAPYKKPGGRGRILIMCHLMADTTEELLAMVDRIQVPRKWIQFQGTYREHFDICQSKRVLAVKAGALEIAWSETGRKMDQKKIKRGVDKPPGVS